MTKSLSGLYVLLPDHSVRPEEHIGAWAEAIKDVDRRVASTRLDDGTLVSTVFILCDHSFLSVGPPLLFETMVFTDDGESVECVRYATWEEAERGHAEIVRKLGK